MPRSLEFVYRKKHFQADLRKVDRDQLYGSVRVLTRSADDDPCTLATLANDGKTLIPRGGTALGYVNTEGEWIKRNALQPVDLEGKEVLEVASSFDAPVTLSKAVPPETLLDHNVRLSYVLEPDSDIPKALLKALNSGKLFQFGFSYRGGVSHDPAFVLADENQSLWMLVTSENDIQYVSLEQAALCGTQIEEDEVEDDDEGDALDFGML